MNNILSSLKNSVKHLDIIDKAFLKFNHEYSSIYKYINKELRNTDKSLGGNFFTEELYVGGKKKGREKGYSRQMILSDVIQFIINGRGYFYAMRNQEAMKNYIKIILLMTNQLMIWDSLGTEVNMRKQVLKKLKRSIGSSFIKDTDMQNQYHAILKYKGAIGLPVRDLKVPATIKRILNEKDSKKAKEKLDNFYDSILPKPLGLWGELLVYTYLLRKNIGYIFPLLLIQEILSGDSNDSLNPPDFLILPRRIKSLKLLGIEVGAGKDIQSGDFSTLTGIPTTTKANMDNPKRCCICGKWILFCPYVINEYSDLDKKIENIHKPIKCTKIKCPYYSKEEIMGGKCQYSCHQGGLNDKHVMEMKGNKNKYHFHLSCLLKTKNHKISEAKIKTFYPYVGGLGVLEKVVNKELSYITKIKRLEQENKKIRDKYKEEIKKLKERLRKKN